MTSLRRTISAAWPPVLLFVLLAGSTFLSGRSVPAARHDQDLFHYQVVRQFEAEWPVMDITNYGTATGPGYHFVLATASKVVGHDLDTLRLLSMVMGVLLLTAVAGWGATVVAPRAAAFLTLPLSASIYVVASGIHVHTDNFGWFFVALVVGSMVFMPMRGDRFLVGGLCSLLAVSVRQIFLWTTGLMVLSGLLASPFGRRLPASLRPSEELPPTWKPLGWALLASIPAILLLLVFVLSWGGLVPARFRSLHSEASFSWCAFGYSLALLALYAPFFLMVIPEPLALLHRTRRWLALAAVAGAFLAVLGPTSPDFASGRHGGPVWMLAGVGPQLGDRSLALAVLAVIGAVSGTLLFSAAVRNGRGALALLLTSVWVAINVANVANTQLFQRYVDTPSLILLGWMSALALAGRSDAERRASVGPALLTVILAALILVVTGV